jgi:hypothetical protein
MNVKMIAWDLDRLYPASAGHMNPALFQPKPTNAPHDASRSGRKLT